MSSKEKKVKAEKVAKPAGERKGRGPSKPAKARFENLLVLATAQLKRALTMRPVAEVGEQVDALIIGIGDARMRANLLLADDWKGGRKLKAMTPEQLAKLEERAAALQAKLQAAKAQA